jgi:hypothetical protein
MVEIAADWKKYWDYPKPTDVEEDAYARWTSDPLPALKAFASRVLSIVPHAAPVESLFSKLAANKSKSRNSMDVEHLAQITHIKESLSSCAPRKRKRGQLPEVIDDRLDALEEMKKAWDDDDVFLDENIYRDFMNAHFEGNIVKFHFRQSASVNKRGNNEASAKELLSGSNKLSSRLDWDPESIFG